MNLINNEFKIEYLIFLPIILILVNFFLVKKNILIDNIKFSKHKILGSGMNRKIPLSGGIFVILSLILLSPNKDFIFLTFLVLITTIGILSDLNRLKSPNIRLMLQSILIFLFLFINNIHIAEIRIDIIDQFLENKFISTIFTLFCILILLNGSNFIDGLNNLQTGYYILVLIAILMLANQQNLFLDYKFTYLLLGILIVFYIFNFFGLCFLGDGGSYIISIICSLFVIDFANTNSEVSPYFIVLLLWYPAFENFFSITRRKFFNKKNVLFPDNFHFHQLLFITVKKYIPKNNFSNTISGNLIVLFQIVPFYIASQNYSSTQVLTLLIYLNIFIYVFFYFKLKDINKF